MHVVIRGLLVVVLVTFIFESVLVVLPAVNPDNLTFGDPETALMPSVFIFLTTVLSALLAYGQLKLVVGFSVLKFRLRRYTALHSAYMLTISADTIARIMYQNGMHHIELVEQKKEDVILYRVSRWKIQAWKVGLNDAVDAEGLEFVEAKASADYQKDIDRLEWALRLGIIP